MKIVVALLLFALFLQESNAGKLTVKCSSYHFNPQECRLSHYVDGIYVAHQLSKSRCIEGETFFVGEKSVIVIKGCRAVFGYYPSSEPVGVLYSLKTCSSHSFRPQYCPVDDYIDNLLVAKRLSKSHCILGKSFFNKDDSILVTHGCRAVFVVGSGYDYY